MTSRRALIKGAGAAMVATATEALGQTSGSESNKSAPQAPSKPKPPAISAAFPFESKYANVLASRMHYVEVGAGDPIVLVHGIPTSTYLWRNVIPFIAAPGRRVIAVDNIGYGNSGKPDITFSWLALGRYLEAFIRELNLKNVTLVMHDLGGAIGLYHAWQNSANVRGFAYLEAALPPAYPRSTFASFGATEPLFRRLRDPVVGRKMLIDENYWVETFLPASVMRDLSAQELTAYRAPFATVESRKSIFDMVQSLPIEGQPPAEWNAYEEMARYWLASRQQKLVIYGTPGRVTPRAGVDWAIQNLKNVEAAWAGYGIHFLHEDSPEGVGRAVSEWLRRRFESQR